MEISARIWVSTTLSKIFGIDRRTVRWLAFPHLIGSPLLCPIDRFQIGKRFIKDIQCFSRVKVSKNGLHDVWLLNAFGARKRIYM